MLTHRALLALGLLTGGALAQDACPATIRLLFKASPDVSIACGDAPTIPQTADQLNPSPSTGRPLCPASP